MASAKPVGGQPGETQWRGRPSPSMRPSVRNGFSQAVSDDTLSKDTDQTVKTLASIPMTLSLKICLAQQHSNQNPSDMICRAADLGADIVVFPEMYSNGYARFEPGDTAAETRWRADAVSLQGNYIEKFRHAARQHRVHIVATLLETGDPDPYNSALLVGPGGNTVLHHRKVHICDWDSPERACARGTAFDVKEIETPAGPVTVGLMICMDREYPEAAVALSARGAEIALVPNCCYLGSDPVVGDVRIAQARGRAFETVMGIAVANYPAPKCDGTSVAVDARGHVIAIAGAEPAMLMADFDLAAIRKTRAADAHRWRRAGSTI